MSLYKRGGERGMRLRRPASAGQHGLFLNLLIGRLVLECVLVAQAADSAGGFWSRGRRVSSSDTPCWNSGSHAIVSRLATVKPLDTLAFLTQSCWTCSLPLPTSKLHMKIHWILCLPDSEWTRCDIHFFLSSQFSSIKMYSPYSRDRDQPISILQLVTDSEEHVFKS